MSALLTIFAWMIATVAWMMLTAPVGAAQLADAKTNRIDDFWNGNSADTAPLEGGTVRADGSLPRSAQAEHSSSGGAQSLLPLLR